MALPALIPVVMIGARVVARFAASKAGQKAAQKFAKEFGGRVVKKSKDLKSVQKAPTGSKATQQMVSKMKANTINPAKSGMRPGAGGAKPKGGAKPDPRGSTTQKLLLAGATTGLASGVDTGKPKKAAADPGKSTMTDAQLSSGRNRGKDNRAAPGGTNKGADPAKKYNVGVSKGGVPFREAFAYFRKKGAKTFTWNGKKYTTKLKSEK